MHFHTSQRKETSRDKINITDPHLRRKWRKTSIQYHYWTLLKIEAYNIYFLGVVVVYKTIPTTLILILIVADCTWPWSHNCDIELGMLALDQYMCQVAETENKLKSTAVQILGRASILIRKRTTDDQRITIVHTAWFRVWLKIWC